MGIKKIKLSSNLLVGFASEIVSFDEEKNSEATEGADTGKLEVAEVGGRLAGHELHFQLGRFAKLIR